MRCKEVGVKKRKTTSYTYSPNLWATSKESTPHSSKRCLFTFQERLMAHRTPSRMEKHALVNTEILSHFPIYSSNISFIPLALYESFLKAQEVHDIVPLKPALPTHNRILNTALLTLSSLLSCFKKHFGAPCRILLLHSTPSTKSEVAGGLYVFYWWWHGFMSHTVLSGFSLIPILLFF